FPISRRVLCRLGPELAVWLGHRLRSANRMTADDTRDDVRRVLLLVRNDRKPIPSEDQGAFGAVELQTTHAGGRNAGGAFAPLTNRAEAGILDHHVLRIGHFTIVLEEVSAAGARDGVGAFDARNPVHDVERVLTEVGHLAARIVPEPPEMV